MNVPLPAVALAAALLLAGIACGDDGSARHATTVTGSGSTPVANGAAVTPIGTPAGSFDGPAGAGTLEIDGKRIQLETVSCTLPDEQDGAFSVNAKATDGNGTLVVVSVGGLGSATIEFDGVAYRSPGARPTFDGSTVRYSGRAASGPLASDAVDVEFSVGC